MNLSILPSVPPAKPVHSESPSVKLGASLGSSRPQPPINARLYPRGGSEEGSKIPRGRGGEIRRFFRDGNLPGSIIRLLFPSASLLVWKIGRGGENRLGPLFDLDREPSSPFEKDTLARLRAILIMLI